VAAGIVVTEGDVDGNAGEGGAEAGDDVGGGLFDEALELGVGGVGEEQLVAAVELVADDVSGEDGESDGRAGREGLGVNGLEGRLEEAVVGVDEGFDGAGFVDGGVVGYGGGGGRLGEDGGPLADGCGVEAGSLGGVSERVEVDVGEEDSGDCGGGWCGFRLGECGECEEHGCEERYPPPSPQCSGAKSCGWSGLRRWGAVKYSIF
jgi:hypothetical protein